MSERKDFQDFGIDIPHGATGEVRTTCPQCTPTRKPANQRKKDLAVNVAEGVFYCHHCSWQGSLGSGPGRTGSSNPMTRKPRTGPAWAEPRPLPAAATPDLWENAVGWFGKRGIPEPVIARMHVTAAVEYCPVCDDRVGHVLFPFYAGGDHVNTKHRCGKKHFRMERGAKRILYNLDCVSEVIKFQDDVDAPLVIVEGEIDALSVMAAGIDHVVSVPDGAPAPHATNYSSKFDFLSHAERLLQQVRQIVIAVDGDEPGRKLQHELARRLGPERCSIVTWDEGIKDANECLVVAGPGYLRSCIESAQPIPVKGIYTGNELSGELRDLYRYGVAPGYDFGVTELDELLSIKTGYISVWVGIPSHGKSTALDQLLVWQAQRHGNRAALFSPEQQPLVKHQQHLIEQYTGKPFHEGPRPRMSESEMLAANNWVSDHFSFILPEETSIDTILSLAKTQVYRRGVKVIVVDPWNELEHSRERHQTETEYISGALSKFRAFARTYDVHFALVAHPTKMRRNDDGSEPIPGLWDISGCYSDDTEYLSRTGWKHHADWRAGEEIACFDPTTNTTRWAVPERRWEYDHDGEMIHFNGYGLDCLVTPNHRMIVAPQHVHTPKNPDDPRILPRTWRFEEARNILRGEHRTPIAAPMEGGSEQSTMPLDGGYQMDDFLTYVGWWVSEGCMQMGGPSIAQGEGTLAGVMQATLDRMGLAYKVNRSKPSPKLGKVHGLALRVYARKHPEFSRWIPEHCGVGSASKRLPEMTWNLCQRQKAILFDALMQGDGSPRRGDGWRYSTVSRQLADDVTRLACEIGRAAKVSVRPGAKEDHGDQYCIEIGQSTKTSISIRPVRPRYSNVFTVPYTGKVWCFTTPTGAYVTRRRGQVALQGNSAHFRNKADIGVTIWRDLQAQNNTVELHVTKMRFSDMGKLGSVTFGYEPSCKRLYSLQAPKAVSS